VGGMKIVRIEDVAPQALLHPIITGDVSIQRLIDRDVDGNNEQCHVALVNFAPGGGNDWHVHTAAQLLIVTSGSGIVATDDEEASVQSGAVIYIAPGVRHRHGATASSAFSHLSVTWAAARTAAAPGAIGIHWPAYARAGQ
jgi:quercetin dioxygenase-like cupin family protein